MSKKNTVEQTVDILTTAVEATGVAKFALVGVVRKTVIAYAATRQDTTISPTGNPKKKTRPQTTKEQAIVKALFSVLADWPGQPYGMTELAVFEQFKLAHDTVAAREFSDAKDEAAA